jgi:hypothetical protein
MTRIFYTLSEVQIKLVYLACDWQPMKSLSEVGVT